MADPMSIIGGIASCVQLLGLLIDSTKGVARFCNQICDALQELERIKYKLELLQKTLQRVEEDLGSVDDHIVLPQELWQLVGFAVRSLEEDIQELYGVCSKTRTIKGHALFLRIKYVLLHRDSTMRMLDRLGRSENTLTCILELINL